jgi:hypothetical protein
MAAQHKNVVANDKGECRKEKPMTKRTYLEDMDRLLAGTAYDKYAHAVNMNVAATAFVLGIGDDQVRKIMRGYPRVKIGNSVLYAKEDVYAAWKEQGVLTA